MLSKLGILSQGLKALHTIDWPKPSLRSQQLQAQSINSKFTTRCPVLSLEVCDPTEAGSRDHRRREEVAIRKRRFFNMRQARPFRFPVSRRATALDATCILFFLLMSPIWRPASSDQHVEAHERRRPQCATTQTTTDLGFSAYYNQGAAPGEGNADTTVNIIGCNILRQSRLFNLGHVANCVIYSRHY
jgi:hypothetical protein